MNLRFAHSMTGLCGILGAVVLVTSFVINPTPPDNLTTSQLGEFARQHHSPIILGGWLQGIGSLLLVLFALALVHLAGLSTASLVGSRCLQEPASCW
ncbi:MAG: hypothetical protein IVW51_10660 [Thermaceae bacterium]|nr:hypothetical protein [Thermaceae bacterium]